MSLVGATLRPAGPTWRGHPIPAFPIVALVGVIVLTGTLLGRLEVVAAVLAMALGLMVSLRRPLLPLYVFAAMIPIEELGKFGDLGSISRVAGLLFAVTYAIPRLGRLPITVMPMSGWLYAGWVLLSIGWALDPGLAALELPTFAQLFVIGVLVATVVVRRPDVIRPLMWIYSVSASITAVVALQTYLSAGTDVARTAAFADQDVAQFAAILLPALIFVVFELARGRLIPLSAFLALLLTAGVVISGTRAVWISAAIVSVAFILPRVRATGRVVALTATTVIILAVLQLPGVLALISNRAGDAVSTGGAGRTDIWTVAQQIFEAYPVTGVGFANFPIAYTPERIRAADVTGYTSAGFAPHSILFGTLGELGLIGLVLLGAFLVPLLRRPGWGPDGAVVQALLASILINALFIDMIGNRKQVWLVIGMAVGLRALAGRGSTGLGGMSSVTDGRGIRGRQPHARRVGLEPRWPRLPALNAVARARSRRLRARARRCEQATAPSRWAGGFATRRASLLDPPRPERGMDVRAQAVIASVRGRYVLQSHADWTAEVSIELADGANGRGAAPLGETPSIYERSNADWRLSPALLGAIRAALVGRSFDQAGLDAFLEQHRDDWGTRIVYAISVAFYEAARSTPQPGRVGTGERPPRILFNLLNGGLHAYTNPIRADITEILLVPRGRDLVEMIDGYRALLRRAPERLATCPETRVGAGRVHDLGNDTIAAGIELVRDLLDREGLAERFGIMVDASAGDWYVDGAYRLPVGGRCFETAELVETWLSIIERTGLEMLEDPLAERDVAGWAELHRRRPSGTSILGDNLTSTTVREVEAKADLVDGVLIKPDQNGTVTGTREFAATAARRGLRRIASHRSIETDVPFLSHLAVDLGIEDIKIGPFSDFSSIVRTNELLRLGVDGAALP